MFRKRMLAKKGLSRRILAKASLSILALLVLFFTPAVLNGREEKPANSM